MISIWKSEGFKGLFSGFTATIARDAPFSGLYLMFYNKAKDVINKGILCTKVLFFSNLFSVFSHLLFTSSIIPFTSDQRYAVSCVLFYIFISLGFDDTKYKANLHFVCGLSAGILASVVTQPADVIKTQMQLYPFRYKNTIDCVFVVVKNNGFLGLFRGTLPRCIRRTLMAALTWTVYESVMEQLGLKV